MPSVCFFDSSEEGLETALFIIPCVYIRRERIIYNAWWGNISMYSPILFFHFKTYFMAFKEGDVVVRINSDYNNFMRRGKIYRVLNMDGGSDLGQTRDARGITEGGWSHFNFRRATPLEIVAYDEGFPSLEEYQMSPISHQFPKGGVMYNLFAEQRVHLIKTLRDKGKENIGSINPTQNIAWGPNGYWYVSGDSGKPAMVFKDVFPTWRAIENAPKELPSFIDKMHSGYVRVKEDERPYIENYFNDLGYKKHLNRDSFELSVFAFYPHGGGGTYQYLNNIAGKEYLFQQFFPNFTNKTNNDIKTTTVTGQGLLGGRIIKFSGGRSQITSAKRLIGNTARGKKVRGRIIKGQLSYSILAG